MANRFLVKGGCVLNMAAGNLSRGDVLIEGSLIAEVGPDIRARAEVVDASEAIVMPGFVDTHRHTRRALGKHGGEVSTAHWSAEDVYVATLIGLAGAAEAGITTVADWFESADGEATEAALQAHRDSGLRTILVATDPVTEATTPLVGAAVGLTPSDGERRWAQARERGARIHLHLTGGDSLARVRHLLGPEVTVVHPYRLDETDTAAISAKAAGVALAPASEMAAGRGMPPMQQLLDADIRPGLGTGSEFHAPGDAFAAMRAAISVQHAAMFDLKLAGKAGLPSLLTTRQVIRYATIDGARAIGLESVTGSLQPGKQADLVVLSADRPNIAPVNDPIGAVVWGMDTSNLEWVFVGGRPIMAEGELRGDLIAASGRAEAARRRLAVGQDREGGAG